jgi:hypothetical protein
VPGLLHRYAALPPPEAKGTTEEDGIILGFPLQKMNFLNNKASRKNLTYVSISVLLVSIVMSFLFKNNNTADIFVTNDLLSSITPTPFPLQIESYDTPSFWETALRQLLTQANQPTHPVQILDSAQKLAEDEHLILSSIDDYLPVEISWWQEEVPEVYSYVSERLGATTSEKIILIFLSPRPGNCATRGMTYHEQQPVIAIYANEETSKEQILAVLAHEFGHVLIAEKYETLNDLALNEGMATWAAGNYWTKWKDEDFDTLVKASLENETYLSLFHNYSLKKAYDDNLENCLFHRDQLLEELASFLDYLIQNYGQEKLSTLFDMRQPELINNQRIIYRPDFQGIYGTELNQLEYEWLNSLLQTNP